MKQTKSAKHPKPQTLHPNSPMRPRPLPTPPNKPDFRWVPSKHPEDAAFIAIDAQKRLYFNVAARALLSPNHDPKEVTSALVGFDSGNSYLTIAPADTDAAEGRFYYPHRIDKRGYASARPFISDNRIPESLIPARFEFLGVDEEGANYPKGSFVFAVRAEAKADA